MRLAMRRRAGVVLGAGLLLWAAGCTPGAPSEPAEALHIKKVYSLCNEYRGANNKAPASLDELKKWATAQGKAQDADFSSPRDGQPYVIVAVPPPINMVILHEQTGKDGKRYVVNIGGAASDDE